LKWRRNFAVGAVHIQQDKMQKKIIQAIDYYLIFLNCNAVKKNLLQK